ncbi:MAG: site-2 protease family protein [Bryobacteraceae bacterium]|nr:site-2 protease family protein [Bryobacteraceae bacterium]
MNAEIVVVAFCTYLVFLFSTVCHEAAHALAAKLGGDLTAYHGGQVSLNPVPHIQREPFGLGLYPILTLFLTGGTGIIGFASAPYDPYWAMRNPRAAAWMAMAGPAANYTLALISGLLLKLGYLAGVFRLADNESFGRFHQLLQATNADSLAEPVALALSLFFYLNLMLGTFNLMPIPPLDGFSIFLFFLPPDAVRKFFEFRASVSAYSFLAIFFFSRYFFWDFFEPIFIFCARLVLR